MTVSGVIFVTWYYISKLYTIFMAAEVKVMAKPLIIGDLEIPTSETSNDCIVRWMQFEFQPFQEY